MQHTITLEEAEKEDEGEEDTDEEGSEPFDDNGDDNTVDEMKIQVNINKLSHGDQACWVWYVSNIDVDNVQNGGRNFGEGARKDSWTKAAILNKQAGAAPERFLLE